MRIAINAWFWNQHVGSGQYLTYLLPALLAANDTLEIALISPKPFEDTTDLSGRVSFHVVKTPFPTQTSNLAKVWFEQITFPRACRKLGVDLAHVPYFGSPLSPSVPTVVTIHDLIPMVLPEYRGSLL
ncbi:MAG: glycosyltransferase family 1 protein, partial [Chloroflexota bacterium]